MFAALIQEREPLEFSKFWDGFEYFIQVAGGFVAAGIVLYLIFRRLAFITPRTSQRANRKRDLGYFLVILAYLIYAGVTAPSWAPLIKPTLAGESVTPPVISPGAQKVQNITLLLAGALALVVAGLPLLADLATLRIRARRIWAVARLSFKEAIRRKVLWAFVLILIIFLFGSWFQEASNPRDQVRNYIATLSFVETILLLIAAGLLAAFSLPTEIKNQTIHTILTKPVERFEVVIGRFLGYMLLMTGVLFFMTTLSLGYLFRTISPEAQKESLKARVPELGLLEFDGTENKQKGTNVGREWEYRGYISGPTPAFPNQAAVWNFHDLSPDLANRDNVVCEFTFDIYRTSKGQFENKGVFCTFQFATWQWDDRDEGRHKEYENAYLAERVKPKPDFNALAEKFGYYELKSVEVTDFHTQAIELPSGLFKNALSGKPPAEAAVPGSASLGGETKPRLRVRVRCNDKQQYVGMARYDLYFRLDDLDQTGAGDRRRFAMNFYKSAFGLWLKIALVVALSLTFSTYLSGIISALLTACLYIGGFFQDWIHGLAQSNTPGGGPMESFYRLVQHENMLTPLEQTATVRIFTLYDAGFRWFLNRVLDVLPDIDRFDFIDKVSEGFNIPASEMFLSFMLLLAYLVPLALLAYHSLRSREIAST